MLKGINLFWWRWLIAVTAGVFAFGLALVFLPDIMMSFFNWLFFSTSKANASFSDKATNYITFIYGVLGAVMIGWAVAFFLILIGSFRRGEREAWYAIASSIAIWFVIDTGFSLIKGFVENAMLNTGFFVLFAVPLAATYRHFHSEIKS